LGSSPSGGGIREFVRRISHSGGGRPVVNQNNATMTHEAAVDQLVDMGFPRALAARQLHLSGNDPKKAAEYLVHAAHPRQTGSEAFSHPDCPVCVREMENIRIAEGRRSSVSGLLDRVRSRNSDAGDLEPHDARRGSVGAMLRRPSISAALARMTTRDIEKR
jgi:hypothetical protein